MYLPPSLAWRFVNRQCGEVRSMSPSQAPFLSGDVIETRRETRIILSVPAQYSLAGRFDMKGDLRRFSGRMVNISSSAMTLFAPVIGVIGQNVFIHCEEFGRLNGQITRPLERGFVSSIIASDEERERLAARIEGYEKIKNHDLTDRRQNKRIMPMDPRTDLFFSDGSRHACFVIDASTSGVAVSAEITPKLGMPLAVGSVVGRVVRHFRTGFAVKFIQLQNLDDLEQKLLRP
jgi:hypothetical protein